MKINFILKSVGMVAIIALSSLNLSASNKASFSKADEDVKGFQLGLFATTNVAWVKPNQPPLRSNGPGMGFGFGASGDFNFSKTKKNYFLALELMYSSMRNKIRLAAGPYTQKRDQQQYNEVEHVFKLNYVELPVSLKLKVNEIGYTTFFAQFGFAPGVLYRTQAKWKGQRTDGSGEFITDFYRNNSAENSEQEFEEYRDDIRFYRLAMIIGAGMEYKFSGNTALLIAFRFNNGLTNVFSDNREPKVNGINNYLGLNVGLLF
jgi:opacity protein-like surface antigen